MKDTYQLIVLGPGGVGKTKGTNALMRILQALGFETSEVQPWTEAFVTTSSYVIHNFEIPASYFDIIDRPLKIVIYDMGGQFKYKKMWQMHAEDTDGIIAVVDMTRKTTLRQIPLMLPTGLMENIPVRLIVNKADLYTEFSQSSSGIADNIQAIVQQTKSSGMVDYSVSYKGDERFVFNSKEYRYGDQISIMRELMVDDTGNIQMRIADFEAIIAIAFKRAMPDITEHNAYLFGREYTLQIFEELYKKSDGEGTVLDDELVETAHNEAPPFIGWGDDPDVFVPINELDEEIIKNAVNSMLIEENDLWQMVEKLRQQGFNIDIGDENSWAMTSAMLLDENPNVNYKPMHKAVLPPFFIKKMVEYNMQKKQNQEEDFFI